MKIVYNRFIPFKGFLAINLFGVLFVRKEYEGKQLSEAVINHEKIHTAQMKELLYIPFYIIYFFEWLVRLVINTNSAYRSISFEQEAYNNQNNMGYLKTRKHFAM